MAITERLAMLVTLDAQGAIKGFENLGKAADRNLSKTDQRLDRMASGFQKAGAGMLAGAGLAAAGMYKAGQAAGNLEQAVGGTEAVFGEASGVIDEFAKKAAQAAGLSESAFRTATTSIGGQLKGLGFDVDDAAAKAVDLTQVAADLSATYGGTTAEAVAALGAAFRGEADPAERFNLFLNQNRVNAKAVALGLAETTSSVDANAKAQATLALITEQSADAQGQFAREADTAQGSMARFKASTDNLLAALGGAVAPVIADVADGLGGLVEKFNDLSPNQQAAVSRFATLGTAALGAAGALSFGVGKVISMRENLGKLTGPLKSADGSLNNIGKAGQLAGLAVGAAVLVQMGRDMSTVSLSAENLQRALADTSKAGEEQFKTFLVLADAEGRLDDVVRDAAETNYTGALRMIELADAAGVASDRISELRDVAEGGRKVQAQSAIDQEANATAVKETADALDGATDATSDFKRATEQTTSRIGEMHAKFNELTETLRSSIDADFAYEDAIDGTGDALRRLAEAHGITIDAETTATEKAEEVSDATRDARNALLEQADAAAMAADQAFLLADKTLTAADKQRIFRDELAKLASGLSPKSELRKQIEETIARLDALAANRTATIDIAFNEARIHIASSKLLGPDGGRRAVGGPVTAGTGYSTNEYLGAGKGYEWFAPANGTVMAAGSNPYGGSSIDQTIIINNPVAEEPSKSARHLRRVQLESAAY